MDENILRELLGESLRREFAEFDNPTEHKFSLKHRLAMKRIFARYEKNSRKTIEIMPHYRLKQKIIFALVIIILMTLLTGWFIPLRGFSQEQIDWLRSRYDFPNMLIHISQSVNPLFSGQESDVSLIDDQGYGFVGFWRVNDDYILFLYDLEQMGVYTADETDALLYKFEPIDTRPVRTESGQLVISEGINLSDYIAAKSSETPLSSTREFVSRLERQIEYYTARSKDKSRAVDGDAEFAALIRDNFLPLHKGYLELLEKLYAERPDGESSDTSNYSLLVLDKDDRRYLFNINEFEKC